MTPIETMPFPDDPTLAAYAAVLNETGHWATIHDTQWRFVFVTDELRLSTGEPFDSAVQRVGEHRFGPSEVADRLAMVSGDAMESIRESFRLVGPFMLFDMPGGRDELRRVVDPALVDLVDEIDQRRTSACLAWRRIQPQAGGVECGDPGLVHAGS